MLGKTSESDMSARLYDLIYELNIIASPVLLAVLPQLEFKLKVKLDYYLLSFATRNEVVLCLHHVTTRP